MEFSHRRSFRRQAEFFNTIRQLQTSEHRQTVSNLEPGADLIAGVILGARVSEALIQKALAVRKARPDFTVDLVSSAQNSYALTAKGLEDQVRAMRGFL